ncbi:hypothetical protein L3476_13840 [Paenibacillus thiaminolyticus]|uniref:hypothetical protein n=1 Tax=Paenibacillus thiaminolyticus TaxID=49283 RepID=UPI00116235EA|nr:hypothetical protein [Paenibacillus thiaminolyticus]NGP59874.1 hypothetical protein [Paenibacillus thiaminolyticus]NGP59968.1 hypothetical protein [Paenibacillus thiaminolyticus]WCR29702.1 hypothetical protein L3476_13840 [Paenibacillus thiaminolyticus]
MNKLLKIGLLSISLMTVLGTSIQAAPSVVNTTQATHTVAAKVEDISMPMISSRKLSKSYHYATTSNSKVAYVEKGYIRSSSRGTAIIRLYDKNDNEIAAYRVTVYDV